MVNKAKIKGTKWETANVDFLRRWWPKQKRAALEGSGDVGDLTLPEGWAVECKDSPYAGNLPRFLREAEDEAANKGVERFVALVKNRRSKGESGQVQDGYAVTRTRVWAETVHSLEVAEEALEHIAALGARLNSGAIRDSEFAVLAFEAWRTYRDRLDRPRVLAGSDDG